MIQFYPMPTKIKLLSLFFFACLSCNKDLPPKLTSDSFSEEYHRDCIGNDCAQVNIDYFKIKGDHEAATKINFTTGNFIIYFLNSNFDRNIRATTISEAAEQFLKNYEKDKKEFPDLSPYQAEVSMTVSYSSPEILSVRAEYYTYSGGAHGYMMTEFLNFNPSTGTLFTMSSLLENKKGFTDLAEHIFRAENKITLNENINSTGFWFDNDSFYLPDSIGFSEAGVLLIYNQYEIASYSDGPIELLIPMEKAIPYLAVK